MKRVLMLAPQPFFEERGTPIAVRMLLETLARPGKREFDLITYAPGDENFIAGVNHLRIPHLFWTKTIRPGISISKLFADVLLTVKTLAHVFSKPRNYYSHIHAVEESVFMALLCKKLRGIDYVYDMDSSLADQILEKIPALFFLQSFLLWCEALAIRNSLGTIAVCDSLLKRAQQASLGGAAWSELLTDVSLLQRVNEEIDLRAQLSLPPDSKLALYVGNLESYQGVDLLLEAWAQIERETAQTSPASFNSSDWHLVILGGPVQAVRHRYEEKARSLGCSRVHFAGPRPVQELASYLNCAEILTSPRISGNNTPMKIYSYLHAGKAILATDLPTHRQVLTGETALLCAPDEFAAGLLLLMSDKELRVNLAQNAAKYAERTCTRSAFETRATAIYDRL